MSMAGSPPVSRFMPLECNNESRRHSCGPRSAGRGTRTRGSRCGQVEIAVEAGGICGSDLHYFNHGGFGTVRVREPMILGHEVAGTIKALGASVSGLAIGDRVAVRQAGPATPATIA